MLTRSGHKPGAGAPKGNRNAAGNRGGTGRPPKYDPRLIPIVHTLALYGTPDEEIADAIGINIDTLRRWRREKIEFSSGTRVTDEQMAEAARTSLFKNAIGYSIKTERVHFSRDGKATIAEVTEHIRPTPKRQSPFCKPMTKPRRSHRSARSRTASLGRIWSP